MNTQAQNYINNKLNKVYIERDDLSKLCKDRLDFGFDSIYFRFAEVCDELAAYKSRVEGSDPVKERQRMSSRKMHFYNTLEQLLQAHLEEGKNDFNS